MAASPRGVGVVRNSVVRSFLTLLSVLTLSVLNATVEIPVASAYARLSCHQATATDAYGATGAVTGAYATAVSNAANDWTNTPTPLIVYKYYSGSTASRFTVDAYYFGNTGYDGIMNDDGCPSSHIWINPYANWNRYYTDGYSTDGKTQVIVHEIGHVLGLAHSGSSTCSGQPIMYPSSSRYFTCGHIVPQPDDVNGINAIY